MTYLANLAREVRCYTLKNLVSRAHVLMIRVNKFSHKVLHHNILGHVLQPELN